VTVIARLEFAKGMDKNEEDGRHVVFGEQQNSLS
jgi:hypothetical protein